MTAATEAASLENLRVLYQSDDFIVVDKHWDLRIDSKMWYEKNTVQAQLRHRFPLLADPDTYYGFRWGLEERGEKKHMFLYIFILVIVRQISTPERQRGTPVQLRCLL